MSVKINTNVTTKGVKCSELSLLARTLLSWTTTTTLKGKLRWQMKVIHNFVGFGGGAQKNGTLLLRNMKNHTHISLRWSLSYLENMQTALQPCDQPGRFYQKVIPSYYNLQLPIGLLSLLQSCWQRKPVDFSCLFIELVLHWTHPINDLSWNIKFMLTIATQL